MIKLKFHPDNGTAFYKELKQRLDEYFTNTQTSREGNGIMRFKIFLYFGLDILFYVLMINSRTPGAFYLFYLLLGLSIL